MHSDDEPLTPPELQERLEEASRLADEERWAEAFAILAEEEERHPRDATLLCMLGVVATQVDAAGLAYDYYRRALAEQPADPFLLVTLGVALARYDDPEAEGVLRLAALTAPDLAITRLQYGAYLAREGLTEAALTELAAARELDPEDPHIARELGIAQLLAGDEARGLEELERASAAAPGEAELQLLLGLALVNAGRLEEGAEELHRASVELEYDGEAHLASALASATQEWWDEAWEALARAEGAAVAADAELVREAEEALEAGAGTAATLLREQLAPVMLRERLLERP